MLLAGLVRTTLGTHCQHPPARARQRKQPDRLHLWTVIFVIPQLLSKQLATRRQAPGYPSNGLEALLAPTGSDSGSSVSSRLKSPKALLIMTSLLPEPPQDQVASGGLVRATPSIFALPAPSGSDGPTTASPRRCFRDNSVKRLYTALQGYDKEGVSAWLLRPRP